MLSQIIGKMVELEPLPGRRAITQSNAPGKLAQGLKPSKISCEIR